MAALIGLILGAFVGAIIMVRRGGNKKDIAQYAAGYAMLFGIIGLFIFIFLARSAT